MKTEKKYARDTKHEMLTFFMLISVCTSIYENQK